MRPHRFVLALGMLWAALPLHAQNAAPGGGSSVRPAFPGRAVPAPERAGLFAGWRRVETDHLRVFVSPRADVGDPAEYAAARERAAARLHAMFASSVRRRIDFYVWASSGEMADAGFGAIAFADPVKHAVHATPAHSIAHELVHLVVHDAVAPTARVGIVSEGVAVLFDGSDRDRVADARAALFARGAKTVNVRALWTGWDAAPPDIAYPVSGAVMQELLERGGTTRFRELLREQTLAAAERIYPELKEWLRALESRLATR